MQVSLYRLWVFAHSRDGYLIGFRPHTLIGFVVAIGSVLRPQAYSSPLALTYFLKREVRLDRQVSHASPGRHA